MEKYKEAGYDVVAVLTQGEFIHTEKIAAASGICTIDGMEYIEEDGILCVGVDSVLQGSPQEIIDQVARQGGFSVVAHPHWESEPGLPMAMPRSHLDSLSGYVGIEIMNPAIFRGFAGSGLATDVWDEFLSQGKLVWGFGNDDFHVWPNLDRAWNMVHCEPTFTGVKAAVTEGRFYASTGLRLEGFELDGLELNLAVNGGKSTLGPVRFRFVGENGAVLQESSGDSAGYTLDGSELYVRVEAQAEHGAMLWTQPVYDEERFTPMWS
ncbi:hypothetical protein [Amnibacterium sp.]|uniref:hypothetical protein n=1 Tax=Amnibacterium sp. TaxID=1872496 RepID=UPI002606F5FF|nr:hypothetical protein [Amnibacterium sp.]